ncbi:unnamed protein product [Closterium sp. Yama58-4]|nr:unnamed protein product [Closterium sp. Yama58-4]
MCSMPPSTSPTRQQLARSLAVPLWSREAFVRNLMAPPWWSGAARRIAGAMSSSAVATIATAGAAAASLATATYYSASPSADSASARASAIESLRGRVISHVASCEGDATGAGSVPAGSGESGGGATGDSSGGSGKEAVRSGGGAGGAEGESAPGVGGAGHQAGSAAIFPLKLLQVQSHSNSRNIADKLQLYVHVMFRHGDRAPMPRGTPSEEEVARWEARLQPRPPAHVLPHRQHTRGIEWPFGQLTRKGFYVLQGLLGSQEGAAQVPINIWGDGEENLYENDRCARGVMLWGRAWKDLSRSTRNPDGSFSDLGWRAQYQHVRESMRSFFNLPTGRFPWLWAVDYSDCRRHHGDPLPPAITPALLDTFRFHLAQDYMRTFSHQEICRLAMGPLLHEVHESMKAAIARNATTSSSDSSNSSSSMPPSSGGGLSPSSPSSPSSPPPAPTSPQPRIFLYSGHDATLMPLSVALGCPYPFWPGYASSIALELWASNDNSTHFARFARILEWSEINKEQYERDCHVAKPRL